MYLFIPETVYFEPEALDYPLGAKLYEYFFKKDIPIYKTTSHNRVTGIKGDSEVEKYLHSKRTLVVGVKKTMKLEPCRPSADYSFSLTTGCPAHCEYCYLQTTMGKRPYIRIYVNLDQILGTIQKYIQKNFPQKTTFEAASSSDPIAVEHFTGSIAKTIEFFANQQQGRLRIVTKFDNIDSLTKINHQGHTRFRFSINSNYVIKNFEHSTPSIEQRIQAAKKIAQAEYPLGFIIAPIMIYDGWEQEYTNMFNQLKHNIDFYSKDNLTFELIQHRYTQSAKRIILERFPKTKLEMDDQSRSKKWGKYGKYKYVYPADKSDDIKQYISILIKERFPNSIIEYFT
ncbi:MAG: spore photoproduct lyase [Clostridia bacterium]|nr:spore photoproduct lyase [Clostridia bacterium]